MNGNRRKRPPTGDGGRLPAGRWRTSGFTLVELLVVVAILAVLAGMLLPSLSRARLRAGTVGCISNLRQLSIAWLLYAGDCRDWLSPSETTVGRPDYPRWVEGYYSAIMSVEDATNTALLLDPGPGHLGPYLREARVFRCPDDDARANQYRPSGPRRARSYSMNNYVVLGTAAIGGHLESGLIYDPMAIVRMGDFRAKSPSDFFVFLDAHALTLANGAFLLDAFLPPREFAWVGTWPAGRHGRRCPVNFADGHIEVRKWADARTAPVVRTIADTVAATQLSRLDNPDFLWLWERAWDPGR